MMRRICIIGMLLALLFGCQPPLQDVHFNGSTMGTTWSVSAHSLPENLDPGRLKNQLQQQLDQVNRLMSTYDPESEVSRFNRSASRDWFTLSQETFEVIELAQQVSDLTGGAFDITVGPLVELWGFGASARKEKLPSELQVAEQLAKVGYQKLELRQKPPAIRKRQPQLQIDLSAVAKGYAVDLLADLLQRNGVINYLVEVGGELRVSGMRPDKTPWKIAIEKPLEGTREVEKIFPLTGTGLATSGNYRNFYIENGQRYVHTINPVNGRPIYHQLGSATVLDPACARADALATALMVLGEARGRQLVEAHHIAAYFLIHDKDAIIEYRSPVFQEFLDKARP